VNEPLKRAGQILSLLKPIDANLEHAERFGSENDGGYVLINDLKKVDFLISMGIANDVNFEIDLSKYVAGSHLYDDSIDELPLPVPNGTFFKERIGGSGLTLISDAINRAPMGCDLILKIDIEGSELEAFSQLKLNEQIKFRQIVVEYHWLEKIVEDTFYSQLLYVLEKLDKTHFVFNSHPNNHGDTLIVENLLFPSVIEVTYLRREDYRFQTNLLNQTNLLSKLNKPCNPMVPEIYFPGFVELEILNVESNSIGTFSSLRISQLTQERDALTQERDALTQERDALTSSTIWRFSTPYRKIRSNLRTLFKN
jgi:hypothetical protein